MKAANGIACRVILDEYNKAPKNNSNYRWTFGNTMAVIMATDYIDDVVAVVQDENSGESRQMFVAALGNKKSSKVRDVLTQSLINKSDVIRKEAQKTLK